MTKFDLSKLKARIEGIANGLDGMETKIGFPSNIQYEDGTSVAYVATIQNYGAPAAKIPPRPFMEPSAAKHGDKWVKVLTQGISKVATGQSMPFDALDLTGRVAAEDVKQTIEEVTSPPLSPITLLLRDWRREGRTITGKTVGEAAAAIKAGVIPKAKNEPLTDTGFMIAAVQHNVSKSSDEDFTA